MISVQFDNDEEPVLDTGAVVSEDQLHEEHHRVIARVTWRVMPLVWTISFFSYLSRTNLANMHVVLMGDMNMSEFQFGFALGIFYISYVIFQLPSNLFLERMRINIWLAILLASWGCITMLSVFITGPSSLMAVRFFLGITEAGLFPGIVYYITLWFGEEFRAQKLSLLQTAVPVSYAIGGITSSFVLKYLNNVLGMHGWRWLFLLTGIPAVFLSFFVYRFLPNSPYEAHFLNEKERKVLLHERSVAAVVWTVQRRTSPILFWSTIRSAKNWLIGFCGMFFVGSLAGVNGFAPAILFELGSPNFVNNFLIAIPSVISVIAMAMWSSHSDHDQERYWHTFAAMFIALLALACSIIFVYLLDVGIFLALLTVFEAAFLSGHAIFITYMCGAVTGSTSIAIGLYFSVAGSGGWIGPFLMGYARDITGDHVVSLAAMCGSLAIGISLFSVLFITQRVSQAQYGSSQMSMQVVNTKGSKNMADLTEEETEDDTRSSKKTEAGAILT